MSTLAMNTAAKRSARHHIADRHGVSKKCAGMGLISFSDEHLRDFIASGITAIGYAALSTDGSVDTAIENAGYLEKIAPADLSAFDFFVTDMRGSVDVMQAMRAGLVPILPRENIFSELLSEFDPMKFEGNAFLFSDLDPFRIFEKIVAYKENVKFPEDRRILLRNVERTFS